MTVPVVAIFTIKPGSEDQAEKLFRGVIEETLKEPGCMTYQLNRDSQNPRRFIWTEEWQSQALLEQHLNAPHIVKLFGELPPLVEHSEVIALNKLAGGAA
ncbi:putative quinol monooxygenase [Pantoea cypripedii]|uniref:Antibiotic biosynthesis monooxygenase n=1 Tax=Pantoea cypripedii TaxID=55209 RepID=A0A6B9FXF8_PANCY|nr:putative quinol monooxygenase [Pantoea cypripedii]QGY29234.1 antibiotic biosynthesis monooxygenase [Pantoea cypripedii]